MRWETATSADSIIECVQKRHASSIQSYLSSDTGDRDLSSLLQSKARTRSRLQELIGTSSETVRIDEKKQANQGKKASHQWYDICQLESPLGPAYIPAETTIRNDYSSYFVDTGAGQLPGNAVCNPDKSSRFEEYPKLKRLIEIKSSLLASISHPPFYLRADLIPSLGPVQQSATNPFHLSSLLPIKYDVVIIDPPLESYEWESVPRGGERSSEIWSWDQVAALPIPQIMAKESFVFLWIGSGASDGLERGREVLMRWGYRRCEDIVWVQTNRAKDDGEISITNEDVRRSNFVPNSSSSVFAKSAQHCLMGIRGTVRRSTDTRFVHCNIDTDVIVWPGEAHRSGNSSHGSGSTIDTRRKPPELMDLAENFCLGTRRLELFGTNRNLRRGWLTISNDIGPESTGWTDAQGLANACAAPTQHSTPIRYEKSVYDTCFGVDRAGCALAERINLVPYHEEVDLLRPRSPSSNADRRINNFGRGLAAPLQGHQLPFRSDLAHSTHLSQDTNLPYGTSSSATYHVGGAGISGLGAGGPAVVSKPSGSEMLSGAQASVLMGQAAGTGTGTNRYQPPTSPSINKTLR